jgi:hypothetical protein
MKQTRINPLGVPKFTRIKLESTAEIIAMDTNFLGTAMVPQPKKGHTIIIDRGWIELRPGDTPFAAANAIFSLKFLPSGSPYISFPVEFFTSADSLRVPFNAPDFPTSQLVKLEADEPMSFGVQGGPITGGDSGGDATLELAIWYHEVPIK